MRTIQRNHQGVRIRTICLISFIFTTCYPSISSELVGYENTPCKRFQIKAKIHNYITDGTQTVGLSPTEKEPIGKGQHTWQQIFCDVEQGKVLTRIFFSETFPDNPELPSQILYLHAGESTFIDYLKKRVIRSRYNQNYMDGSNLVWAGRVHAGKVLAGVIKNVSPEITKMDNDRFPLTLKAGAPHFAPPAFPEPITLTVDQHIRVIKLEEKQRVFHFEWNSLTSKAFDYVSQATMQTKGGPLHMCQEMTVSEYLYNPTFPENLFELNYPDSFEKHDLRKLLSPPQF